MDKVIIGKIGAARGLNGEVKLIPLTDFEERFDNLQHVEIDDKTLEVDYVRQIGKNLVIKFTAYETRETVKNLTGKFIKVNKSEAAPLAEGEFYTFDIVGLNVFDLDENKLGVITEVVKTGSNDVFITKSVEGNEILIPALKAVVKKIDIENKIMLIDAAKLEEV